MRSLVTICGLAVVVSAVGTAGGARMVIGDADLVAGIDKRLAAVAKTRGLLDDKYAVRSRDLRRRVRAFYKLVRAGHGPLWTDVSERARHARKVGAARRILRRDVRELALLDEEIGIARRAHTRLNVARDKARTLERPSKGAIVRPVRGAIATRFGRYRGRQTRATLPRRGVQFVSRRGASVVAPAAGVVRFAGPIRGIDRGVVMDHGGFITVVGRLGETSVAKGDKLAAGAIIGRSAGTRVYLETRLDDGLGGLPVDPEGLLGPAQ